MIERLESALWELYFTRVSSEATVLHKLAISAQELLNLPKCTLRLENVIRYVENPMITPDSHNSLGKNINGPSLIEVPGWVKSKLGRYYLYFAHHKGKHIRMAYADSLQGPWKIYEPGVMHLDDAPGFNDHIASPDVHIIDEERCIRMYFHGARPTPKCQRTGIAHSSDGLHFSAENRSLGNFYFRVWSYKGMYYALAKDSNNGWNEICQSSTGVGGFTNCRKFLRRARHTTVVVIGDILCIFYSRVGDKPERILASTVNLNLKYKDWKPSRPLEIIRPTGELEGISFPLAPSSYGAKTDVRQLRDPYVFLQDGKINLMYTVCGEKGLAGAELHFSKILD